MKINDNKKFWSKRVNLNYKNICNNNHLLDKFESQNINKLIKKSKIFEIGCGAGSLIPYINKKIINYTGIDQVTEMIDICKKKFNDKKYNFFNENILSFDFSRQKKLYRYIISKRVLQNLPNEKAQFKTIDNLGKMLTANGRIIICESCKIALKNINYYRCILNLKKIKEPAYNKYINTRNLKKNNFNNVKLEKIIPFTNNYYFISRILNAFINKKTKIDDPLKFLALKINNNLFS